MEEKISFNEEEKEEIKRDIKKAGESLFIAAIGIGIAGIGTKVYLKLTESRRKFNKINGIVEEIEKYTVKLDEMRVDVETTTSIKGFGGLDKERNKLKDPMQLIKDINSSIIDVNSKVEEILSTNRGNEEIIRCLYEVLDRFKAQVKAYNTRFKYIRKELK